MKIIENYLQIADFSCSGLFVHPTKNNFTWNGWFLYENAMLIDIEEINNIIHTEIGNFGLCAFTLARSV